MPVYRYKGRDNTGQAVAGRLEAASADVVATLLLGNQVTPVEIAPSGGGDDAMEALRTRFTQGRVRLLDLIFFSRQMYTLLRAGVPILQAIRSLQESSQNPALGRVIGSISASLDGGLELSRAMARHPEAFPSLYVSIIQIGESSGTLPESFLQLAQYLEQDRETRNSIKSALRYPGFVIAAISVAMLIVNLFVIPAFAKVYQSFDAELPVVTRILIASSNFTVDYWYVVVGALVGLVAGWISYVRTPAGRLRWHRAKLRLPVAGKVIERATLARFARSVAITMRAGVSLTQGLAVVARAVDNDYVGQRILNMRAGVERGESITHTAKDTGLFPALVLQMIAVGEDTGAVDELMLEVAQYYEREVDYDLKHLSASIEPILITLVGVLVLILALGVFMPMWNLATAVGLG